MEVGVKQILIGLQQKLHLLRNLAIMQNSYPNFLRQQHRLKLNCIQELKLYAVRRQTRPLLTR
jgi:hypothetical protein